MKKKGVILVESFINRRPIQSESAVTAKIRERFSPRTRSLAPERCETYIEIRTSARRLVEGEGGITVNIVFAVWKGLPGNA